MKRFVCYIGCAALVFKLMYGAAWAAGATAGDTAAPENGGAAVSGNSVPIGFPVPSRVENAVGVTPLPPTRFQVVSERVGVLRMYVRVTRTVKGRVEKAAFVDDPVG